MELALNFEKNIKIKNVNKSKKKPDDFFIQIPITELLPTFDYLFFYKVMPTVEKQKPQ